MALMQLRREFMKGDGIFVSGPLTKPVYLLIKNGQCQIREPGSFGEGTARRP
jgi:hypothetical protein